MQIAKKLVPTLALFGSASTLLCCALPALLVALGAGAALAGLVGAMPQLVWLSEHKVALFIIAGILIAGAGLLRYSRLNASCPADPEEAKACQRLNRLNAWLFWLSLGFYATGAFFAFLAPMLM
jgi:hypothetical protein